MARVWYVRIDLQTMMLALMIARAFFVTGSDSEASSWLIRAARSRRNGSDQGGNDGSDDDWFHDVLEEVLCMQSCLVSSNVRSVSRF